MAESEVKTLEVSLLPLLEFGTGCWQPVAAQVFVGVAGWTKRKALMLPRRPYLPPTSARFHLVRPGHPASPKILVEEELDMLEEDHEVDVVAGAGYFVLTTTWLQSRAVRCTCSICYYLANWPCLATTGLNSSYRATWLPLNARHKCRWFRLLYEQGVNQKGNKKDRLYD